MSPTDPIIAAAAILLGLVPGQHALSKAPTDDSQNHIVIRWVGNEPASAPHGVTLGHANAHALAVVRDPPGDPPRHHRRHHHHRRGHHRR